MTTFTRSAKSALKSCPECFTEFEDSVDVCPTDATKLQTVSKDPLVGTMLDDRYLIEGVIGPRRYGRRLPRPPAKHGQRHGDQDALFRIKCLSPKQSNVFTAKLKQ